MEAGGLSVFWAQRFKNSSAVLRNFLFRILSVGAIPNHIAFILDGNRRYAKKHKMPPGTGHRAAFLSLLSMLKYCAEIGIKYVSLYAFSIDNFRRKPEEVRYVMDLIQEKTEALVEQVGVLNAYGVRVIFAGNLKLLSEPIRAAANRAMAATANNTNIVILICTAYTSTEEIMHSIHESCKQELHSIHESCKQKHDDESSLPEAAPAADVTEDTGSRKPVIKLDDINKNMYMAVAPDLDILIRTSGETRMSNFLTWQSSNCLLYSPAALWPEIGLRHLVWAILNYQRLQPRIESKKKQI